MPGDRPAHSLAVDRFDSDKDDFAVWVKMFEDAVNLAHNVTSPADLPPLCIKWLRLKLDENARSIYSNVKPVDPNTALTWDSIKDQLTQLLINPQEKYNWQARRSTIKWDGKESFYALATRVKRNVDKFDPDCNKKQEYFFRFRIALPPDFKKAIDLGCRDDSHETIDEAQRIAYRFLNTQNDESAEEKAVAFTGAAMSDDRLKSIELCVQSMSVSVENLTEKVEKISRGDRQEGKSRGHLSSRERYEKRERDHDDRNRDSRRDRRERGFSGDDRDNYDHQSRGRDCGDSSYRSRDRYRRDNLDCRDDSYRQGESHGRGDSHRQGDSRPREESYRCDDSYRHGDSRYHDDSYHRGDSQGYGGSYRRRDSHSSDDGDRRGGYDRNGYTRDARDYRDRHDNRRSRRHSRSDESD